MTSYYTFEIGDENTGYFEISETAEQIDQVARFRMDTAAVENGEIHNIFRLKLEDGQLTAFQYLDDDWIEMSRFTDNCFPSSAYPILLKKANPTYTYQSIYEGAAEITGTLTLTRDGDCISETEDGPEGPELRRRFWLTDGIVTKIDWGGPISRLVGSKEEAVAGSSYA